MEKLVPVPVPTKEMLEMQGVPIHDDALFACGVGPLFDHSVVSAAAKRKMAGNSFNQPCMCAFIGFVLAHLKLKCLMTADENLNPLNNGENGKHILYPSLSFNENDSDDEDESGDQESNTP